MDKTKTEKFRNGQIGDTIDNSKEPVVAISPKRPIRVTSQPNGDLRIEGLTAASTAPTLIVTMTPDEAKMLLAELGKK